MTTKNDINQQILLAAENLIQRNGYNAFSYRDIADIVGVKTSSIHYHFPTKEDLGQAVVKECRQKLVNQLEQLDASSGLTSLEKLAHFFDGVFASTYFSELKMCLGGMLAADLLTLPENIRREVKQFFAVIEQWLVNLLAVGVENQELHLVSDSQQEAALIVSILEGALLLARLYQDDNRLAQAKEAVILRLTKV